MSKYFTDGWEKFYFIVTPDELEVVLQDMHLLITGRHVPNGYKETPLCQYIADYSVLYSKLISGQRLERSDLWELAEMGIAKSLGKHSYGKEHTYQGAKYQLMDFHEPCALLGYFPIHIYPSKDGKPTLTISASSSQFPEKTVGLMLAYPKQIQYVCDDGISPLQTAKNLASYQDFLTVRDRIKAMTKPLRLSVAGKEIRPRVRISRDALRDTDKLWFFRTNNISAIK